MGQQQFMSPGEHFEALVKLLEPEQRTLYESLENVRNVPCFRNRSFVVYEYKDRKPVQIDNLKVMDFVANDSAGTTCEVRSESTGKSIIVGYQPEKVFDYPVFMFLPLHGKLRWSTTPSAPLTGSLAFDMAVRTKSRFHLRERGIVYCETGVEFAKEFESQKS